MTLTPASIRFACLATALALAGPAAAAPEGAPSPAAMRACASMGAGFVSLPGGACARVGGRVRYEGGYAQPRARGQASTGTAVTGRAFVDARTQTEAGPVRAYVRVGVSRRAGALASDPVR
ncbi:hypothetical protein SLNSH_19955 [Alsobacter soli]|uniref:Porin n=1 Tax=Alsobacter soli TaxID=2109933 RepID=A0A2T1HNH7_9HYPH|nr:porin [Alsobacter soli]PSC03220.1 hypothetical protein SLNSH_19955 [Alsobacter soli]